VREDSTGAEKAAEVVELFQSLPPELQEVVRALPKLPDGIKDTIVTIVKAAVSQKW
jgi:hypothetical protein